MHSYMYTSADCYETTQTDAYLVQDFNWIQSAVLPSRSTCQGKVQSWYSYEFTMLKGVLHPWTLFLKTLCIFSKNKATSDKVSYGSGQKCSKELKNHSFTSVETIVVKL